MRRALGASLICMSLTACGGGGSSLLFQLSSVAPNVSSSLAGGEAVLVHGVNFLDVTVVAVFFGGQAVAGVTVIDDTTIEVLTPPAPGGAPGSVNVTVSTMDAGSQTLDGAYTYQGGSGMAVTSISPTVFTPTGAETFTILGQNLALSGQTAVEVIFAGIGTVTGTVSPGAGEVTGRAPLVAGIPPSLPLAVTVRRAPGEEANAPSLVTIDWAAPAPLPAPFQTSGGASEPVRVADGFAVACLAGADGAWGSFDDEVVLLSGPPATVNIQPIRRPPASPGGPSLPIGYLHPQLSVPVVLENGGVFVYSVGTGAGTRITRIENITGALPAISDPVQALNSAPLASVGPDLLAFGIAGGDGTLGTADDALMVLNFSGVGPAAYPPVVVGPLDASGAASLSVPVSADGANIFVVSAGPDAIGGNADDVIARVVLGVPPATAVSPAPFLLQRPIPTSGTTAFAAGAGANGAPGSADDALEVFHFNGAALTRTSRVLGAALFVGARSHSVRLGGAGALVGAGAGLQVFLDARLGAATPVALSGLPLLAGLPSLEAIVLGPGIDLVAGVAPDEARHVSTGGVVTLFADVPLGSQAALPGADAARTFAAGAGADGVFATGDEVLAVQSARALGSSRDGTILPLSPGPGRPVAAASRFLPLSPGWGIIQSPGGDKNFGTADDHLVLARY